MNARNQPRIVYGRIHMSTQLERRQLFTASKAPSEYYCCSMPSIASHLVNPVRKKRPVQRHLPQGHQQHPWPAARLSNVVGDGRDLLGNLLGVAKHRRDLFARCRDHFSVEVVSLSGATTPPDQTNTARNTHASASTPCRIHRAKPGMRIVQQGCRSA